MRDRASWHPLSVGKAVSYHASRFSGLQSSLRRPLDRRFSCSRNRAATFQSDMFQTQRASANGDPIKVGIFDTNVFQSLASPLV